ncbi:hypothetical protein [Streptomyces sp. NPDC058202]|uniref:hypothetical protein n=1 Tax=Streptomyces sp. NPDC058202 TaxID=3346380 RepID=UPI0036F0D6A3
MSTYSQTSTVQYRIAFARIHGKGGTPLAPVTVTASTVDELSEAIRAHTKTVLGDRSFYAEVNSTLSRGCIASGFSVLGTFTIESLPVDEALLSIDVRDALRMLAGGAR